MRLKRLMLLLCLAASLGVSAQKNVDVEDINISYIERLSPVYPQRPLFFHYTTLVDAPNSMMRHINPSELEQKLFIEEQQYTNRPTANDYLVTAYLEPVEIVKNEIKERVEEKKDKEGQPYNEHYFWVEVSYTFAANGTFTQNDKILRNINIDNRSNIRTFRSPEYSSRYSAENYWYDNREMRIEDLNRQCAEEAMESLSRQLSRYYGFVFRTSESIIKTINQRGHPENNNLIVMNKKLKVWVQSLDGTRPLSEYNMMRELIPYFESIPERYTDPTSKVDFRLRYIAYYNLCRIYLFMDQPEKAKEYANLLIQNGYEARDGYQFIKDAERLQREFEGSYFKSRQFDPSSYKEGNN